MKKIILFVIILIIAAGASFYGGMKYGQSKNSSVLPTNSRANFQARQEGTGNRMAGGANFISGEVIAKDDKSLTLKMADSGSKIVFFSDSTKVSKTIDGLMDDIVIGSQIMVSGEQSSEGIYTAQTIQDRQQIPFQNPDRLIE